MVIKAFSVMIIFVILMIFKTCVVFSANVLSVSRENIQIKKEQLYSSTLPQLLYFQNKSVWVVGDSLMVGWDGKSNVTKSAPEVLSKTLSLANLNNQYSISGSQISGNRSNGTMMDLTNKVSAMLADENFKQADILLLAMGVNDLNYSDNNLGYVQQRLQYNIIRLKNANRKLKIVGILPFCSYLSNKQSDYSISELQDGLQEVYESFSIPALDWRYAGISFTQQDTNDGVHPNEKTYQIMGLLMANFLVTNRNTMHVQTNHLKQFISNGWQVNEQGFRQYAKENVLLTDWHYLEGKCYYFDPATKAVRK